MSLMHVFRSDTKFALCKTTHRTCFLRVSHPKFNIQFSRSLIFRDPRCSQMDVPLHLRLAYANRYADPYADAKRTLHTSAFAFSESQEVVSHEPPLSWFGALVQHIARSNDAAGEVVEDQKSHTTKNSSHGSSLPFAPFCSPLVKVSATPEVKEEPARERVPEDTSDSASSRSSPAASTTTPVHAPDDASLRSVDIAMLQAEEATSPVHVATTALSRPPESAAVVRNTPASLDPGVENVGGVKRKDADTQVNAHTELAEDELTQQKSGVQQKLTPTLQVVGGAAGITAALERRLQTCVLKAAALDDANQQLLCTFQLSPQNVNSDAPTSPSNQATLTKRQDGQVRNEASSSFAQTATATTAVRNDTTLSEEAKKELAMHLYALRHQVMEMREKLDAHEAAHSRDVNVRKVAVSDAATFKASQRPIRVEVVKAYEDEPVPRRKGPWRAADFGAAGRRGVGSGRDKEPSNQRGEEVYSSDGFTSDTGSSDTSAVLTEEDSSVTSSSSNAVLRTQRAKGKAAASSVDESVRSDSTLSSTEALFQRRQAAALQARARREASTAKRGTFLDSTTTTTSTDTTTDDSLTETSTLSTTDTDSS